MKNLHFGEGLERSRLRGTDCFTVLVLIAALTASLLRLIGTAAERAGIQFRPHPNNGKRRVDSRIFLARLLLVLHGSRHVLHEQIRTIAPEDQWVTSGYCCLLSDGAG